MTLGQKLRAARAAAGMSLRDVERATKRKISNGYLSLLESDEIKSPSPHHLHALAAAYRVDYSELMALAGYKPPTGAANRRGAGIARMVEGQPERSEDDSEEQLADLGEFAADLTEEERAKVEEFIAFIRARRGPATPGRRDPI